MPHVRKIIRRRMESWVTSDEAIRFANFMVQIAVAREREACARIVETYPQWPARDRRGMIADAIRARAPK